MILALTGHREQRLNLPTDVSAEEWKPIRKWIKEQILLINPNEVFTGMASGSDMAIGYVVAQMKDTGYDIKLSCILPCKGYGTRNPNYEFIINHANDIIEMHGEWIKGCDNDRDDYMASNCDILLAVYDRTPTGGVYSTINKAKKQHKQIIYCPTEILIQK